jgi:hypothetical protein
MNLECGKQGSRERLGIYLDGVSAAVADACDRGDARMFARYGDQTRNGRVFT